MSVATYWSFAQSESSQTNEDPPRVFIAGEPRLKMSWMIAKGITERIIAIILLILLAPLFVVLVVAVAFSSPGPVFSREVRLGRRGKEFKMLSFRTVYDSANEKPRRLMYDDEDRFFNILTEPRVTPVGAFLQQTALRKLPQLMNILNGSLSFVGPRSPFRREVEMYGEGLNYVLSVKPGITGVSQLSSRRLGIQEILALDLYYVYNWSFMLDLAIILEALSRMFRRWSASDEGPAFAVPIDSPRVA
jgi:lipopolysaccharide/colanic/teichoic acid biosynthesis glycosyltransferase